MNEGDVARTSLPQANGRAKKRPTIAQQRMLGFYDPILADHDDYAASGLKSPSLIRLGFWP